MTFTVGPGTHMSNFMYESPHAQACTHKFTHAHTYIFTHFCTYTCTHTENLQIMAVFPQACILDFSAS